MLRQFIRRLFIQTEITPNEHALKFIPGKPILKEGTIEFTSKSEAAKKSQLALELMRIDGVNSIMFGTNFVSVIKSPSIDWIRLKPLVFSCLMDHFTLRGDQPIVNEVETKSSNDTETVAMIKDVLDMRIRPVIQADGGDVQFVNFNEGTGWVQLKLQGACRSCSSSTITLRNGIESMLMYYVPEVKGVEQVDDSQ